ncbi:MAG: AMP-binding protein [bacterium]|nr:AMP-binding protein [bacterium]
MNLHSLLADKSPTAFAVTHNNNLTFAELEIAANSVAAKLQSCGLNKNDRVALLAENSVHWVAAFFGIQKAGLCAVLLNNANKQDSHLTQLADCDAKVIIGDKRLLARLDSGLPQFEIDQFETTDSVPAVDGDIAVIIYTSGSTGKPRGVTLTPANLLANTHQILSYLNLGKTDSVLSVLPFHYSFGLSLLLTHISCGGRVVIDNRFAFPAKVLETMQQEKVTGFSGVPSHYSILANRTEFLQMEWPHLRYLTQAGGAMAPSLTQQIRETLPTEIDLFVMYGQTEASARLSYLPPEKLTLKYGSIGIPIPGVELVARRSDGSICDTGESGEITASGDNIMQGYWNDPEETAKVLRDGILYTGDIGYKDEDGYFFVVDRVKNFIKAGANRVSAKEIEECIMEINGVSECSVIGVADEMLGEAIEAHVVASGLEKNDILRHCKAKLAMFKIPQAVQFHSELPKHESGKIDKSRL